MADVKIAETKYDNQRPCCSVCDAKRKCVVCGQPTQWGCSDCRMDFKVTIYVCPNTSCRNEHEKKCPQAMNERVSRAEAERDEAIKLDKQHWEQLVELSNGVWLALGRPSFKGKIEDLVAQTVAERDAVAEILGTLAPGGSIVNMAEAARNALEFRGQQLAKRDATIARMSAAVNPLKPLAISNMTTIQGEKENKDAKV